MDNILGRRIKELREAKGWEISHLSFEARVPTDTIRSWEDGTRASPGIDGVSKVAAALGVSVDALLQSGDSDSLIPDEPAPAPTNAPE